MINIGTACRCHRSKQKFEGYVAEETEEFLYNIIYLYKDISLRGDYTMQKCTVHSTYTAMCG